MFEIGELYKYQSTIIVYDRVFGIMNCTKIATIKPNEMFLILDYIIPFTYKDIINIKVLYKNIIGWIDVNSYIKENLKKYNKEETK